MAGPGKEHTQWRGSPFNGDFKFHAGPQQPTGTMTPPFLVSGSNGTSHARHHSFTPPSTGPLVRTSSRRNRSSSLRNSSFASGTFAPQFIKSEELQGRKNQVDHIEGENDFSGKRYVWLKDLEKTFVQGWVIEEVPGGRLLVQCDDGTVSPVG